MMNEYEGRWKKIKDEGRWIKMNKMNKDKLRMKMNEDEGRWRKMKEDG